MCILLVLLNFAMLMLVLFLDGLSREKWVMQMQMVLTLRGRPLETRGGGPFPSDILFISSQTGEFLFIFLRIRAEILSLKVGGENIFN